jgi:hypothetical protein
MIGRPDFIRARLRFCTNAPSTVSRSGIHYPSCLARQMVRVAIAFAFLALLACGSGFLQPAWAQLQFNVPDQAGTAAALKAKLRPPQKADTTADRYTIGIVIDPFDTAAADLATVLNSGQETGPNGEVALRVLPIVGKGGAQNVRDILTLPGADLATTPTILLDRLSGANENGNLKSRVCYITRLYPKELHVLARSEIRSIADLAGKPVNLGELGSGLETLGREILDATGVQVSEVNIGYRDALERVRSGDIAAALIFAGKPVDALATIGRDDGLHLIPVPLPRGNEAFYLPATLGHEDYPNLIDTNERVDTLAVDTVLVAYNWPPRSSRYELMQFFVQAFFSRFAEFQSGPRHPKWQEVNLAAVLPGWPRCGPAERWLRTARTNDQQGALRAEFNEYLSQTEQTGSVRSEREHLFEEFLRWRKQRTKGR